MSSTGEGEWFIEPDGQWTWRQPDGSCWRQDGSGQWQSRAPAPSAVGGSQAMMMASTPAASSASQIAGAAGYAAPAGIGAGGSADSFGGHVIHGGDIEAHAAQAAHQGHVHHEVYHESWVGKPETSAMAVWAMILAVFPPVLWINNILGFIIGLEARHHIKHSHGALRGKTCAYLAMLFGAGWLVTIPIVVHNGINLYHSARTTGEDFLTQKQLKLVLSGANAIETASHTYVGLSASELSNIPATTISSTCGTGVVCIRTGNSFGYSFLQMCELTDTGHAWMISTTSTSGSTWFGESSKNCSDIGDPLGATGRPVQGGSWRTGDFPGVQFHFTWEWKF